MSALAGKCILVTGAARRVGAAIARRLHADGASIVVHCREHLAEARSLATLLNAARDGSAAVVRQDLSDTAALPGLIDAAIANFGRLDALVNNASSFYPTPLETLTEIQWDDLASSNLKAPLFLCRAAASELRRRRGAIVNLIDIHTERPLRDHVAYCAAKAGLAGLTRALALDLAPEVRVNGVAPGPIAWPDAPGSSIAPQEQARILASTPLAREGGAEAIAETVHFLIAGASFVTGQIVNVDGGRSLYL
ncbi:MAG: pteridine reductase [Burkholderiales bacterium]